MPTWTGEDRSVEDLALGEGLSYQAAGDNFSAIDLAAGTIAGPRTLHWPGNGTVAASFAFEDYTQWRAFFIAFALHPAARDVVRRKFARALKVHLLSWVDFDLIKTGELVAWTALELALRDVYFGTIMQERRRKAAKTGKVASEEVRFFELLQFMVKKDGLTDEKIPLIQRSGGSVIGRLTGTHKPGLNQLRNDLAHGSPFDALPQGG